MGSILEDKEREQDKNKCIEGQDVMTGQWFHHEKLMHTHDDIRFLFLPVSLSRTDSIIDINIFRGIV